MEAIYLKFTLRLCKMRGICRHFHTPRVKILCITKVGTPYWEDINSESTLNLCYGYGYDIIKEKTFTDPRNSGYSFHTAVWKERRYKPWKSARTISSLSPTRRIGDVSPWSDVSSVNHWSCCSGRAWNKSSSADESIIVSRISKTIIHTAVWKEWERLCGDIVTTQRGMKY